MFVQQVSTESSILDFEVSLKECCGEKKALGGARLDKKIFAIVLECLRLGEANSYSSVYPFLKMHLQQLLPEKVEKVKRAICLFFERLSSLVEQKHAPATTSCQSFKASQKKEEKVEELAGMYNPWLWEYVASFLSTKDTLSLAQVSFTARCGAFSSRIPEAALWCSRFGVQTPVLKTKITRELPSRGKKVQRDAGGEIFIRELTHFSRINSSFLKKFLPSEDCIEWEIQKNWQNPFWVTEFFKTVYVGVLGSGIEYLWGDFSEKHEAMSLVMDLLSTKIIGGEIDRFDELFEKLNGTCREPLNLQLQNASVFPAHFCRLTSLESLIIKSQQGDLVSTKKEGIKKIPEDIAKLVHLHTFSIFDGALETIPKEIAGLTYLRCMTFDFNRLTSLAPEIGQLRNLEQLSVRANQLAIVPTTLGKLSKLQTLVLSQNQIAALPSEIGAATSLEEIYFSENQLSSLPSEIGFLKNLVTLNADYNQISSLPLEIGGLLNLRTLSLVGNTLSSLPASIGALKNLRHLFLSDNRLSRLPDEIGELTRLEKLALSVNRLVSIPETIGQIEMLEGLSLEGNKLSSLPEAIGNLGRLKELQLGDNKITVLPKSIGGLQNLQWLFLKNNLLAQLPPEIGNLSRLSLLSLKHNLLRDLPRDMARITQLRNLSLDGNRFIFLPDPIRYMTNVTDLSINGMHYNLHAAHLFGYASFIQKIQQIDSCIKKFSQ